MALHNPTKARKAAQKPQARKSADRPRAAAAEAVADRSAAVSKSWKNKSVAAARATKNKVKVGGVEYRSTLAAFEALKLDTNKHITFRGQLKEKGRATFETDKGVKHLFTIVKAD